MSLMSFSASTVQLRRLARAHAAGEVGTSQYHSARRDLINNFCSPRTEDDTQRRGGFSLDGNTSQQPSSLLSQTYAGQARAGGENQESANDARLPSQSDWGSVRGWLLLLLIVGLCLVALQSVAAVGVIGPRSERDPNPQNSPRLLVRKVQMSPSVLDSEVDPAAVQAIVDTALSEINQRHQPGAHGFTDAELQEVGRFLSALGIDQPAPQISSAAAEDLVALVAEQRARRGTSVAELEEIASAVQQYYRERGFFLALVVLPPQRPQDGVVHLSLLPGVLGDVVVNGGDQALVESAFSDLLDQPLRQADVETRFSALKDLSGLKAQMAFSPGAGVGETQLRVDVLEQRQFSAVLRLDNHGYDSTGNDRLGVQLGWLNPRGVGDFLQLNLLTSFDPADQQYITTKYSTPVLAGDWQLSTTLGFNHYDLTAAGLDLAGEGLLLETELARTYFQSRTRSLRSFVGVGRHQLRWQDLEDQELWFTQAGVAGHRVWDDAQVYLSGQTSAELGRISSGRFAGQASSYWRIAAQLFAWKPFSLPGVARQQKIGLRLRGQLAGSQLPATRQLGLGGPDVNPAFDRASYLADNAAQLGIEWRTGLPVGEALIFLDASYGESQNSQRSGLGSTYQPWTRMEYGLARPLYHAAYVGVAGCRRLFRWYQ